MLTLLHRGDGLALHLIRPLTIHRVMKFLLIHFPNTRRGTEIAQTSMKHERREESRNGPQVECIRQADRDSRVMGV